jgi:uncharacterized protein (DUF927 family)
MPRLTRIEDVLFTVEKRPLLVSVQSPAGDVLMPVPHRKAIVDVVNRRVLGIVSGSYRLVTNREALEWAYQCCRTVFPETKPGEWEAKTADAPGTGGHCQIDLVHNSTALDFNSVPPRERPDVFGPFIRVTNSYNGLRALAFDIGFYRKICKNGLILPDSIIRFKFTHQRRDIRETITFEVADGRLAKLKANFCDYLSALRACAVPKEQFEQLDQQGPKGQRWNEEEHYDLYFAINPLRVPLCRKALKDDVAAAAWLWVDLDPSKNEEDGAAQARLDAALAHVPPGIPGPPTWEINSGRGRWQFWKLRNQQPVDGKDGPETLRIEGHGRGVEQAYGKDVADNCRNIDRIARLPGTINHKTGRMARVTAHRPDCAYELADFPFVAAEESAKISEAPIDPIEPGEKVNVDKLPVSDRIRHMIATGEDTDTPDIPYAQMRSERDFAVLIGMADAGCSNKTMAAVLLDATLPIGGHVRDQKKPKEYLARQITKARAKVSESTREGDKPLGYQMKASGLYHNNKVLSAPFEICGRARDPNGQGWARWLKWKDEDGREHTWAVPDAKLHGDPSSLCGELAQRGLRIATGANKRGSFVAYLNSVNSDKRATIVSRTGWCDFNDNKVFVLPTRTIGVTGNETVSFVGSRNAPFGERGTLEQWGDSVGKLTGEHDRAMFAISIAFAAPLVGLIEAESGGFNFYGQSSTGKTSIVRGAASVWGRGDPRGFLRTWRATANGLEGAAVLHNDLPLVLDEVGVAEPKDVGAVIYSLTGERGKDRAQRDGTLKETPTWRTLIISTGELTVADKIREDGRRSRAGQEVRVVDIHADAGAGFGVFNHAGPDNDAQKLADAIKNAACLYYGTAGPALIEGIVAEGIDTIAAAARQAQKQFRSNAVVPADATGQVLRVADRFSLVAFAGELAIGLGIVPWPVGTVLSAAQRLFVAWLDQRGGIEPAEIRTGIEQVKKFIEQFGMSRFDPLEGTDRPVHDRLGWGRGLGSEQEWLIPPQVWKDPVCRGHNPTLVARALAERGMLVRGEGKNLARNEWVEGRSRRVYVLTAKVAEDAP